MNLCIFCSFGYTYVYHLICLTGHLIFKKYFFFCVFKYRFSELNLQLLPSVFSNLLFYFWFFFLVPDFPCIYFLWFWFLCWNSPSLHLKYLFSFLCLKHIYNTLWKVSFQNSTFWDISGLFLLTFLPSDYGTHFPASLHA